MKAWVKLLLLVALAGAGALLLTPSNGPDPAQVGKVAPPLVLPDLAGGREVSLASLRGKAVALNFWATWCQPCKEEMPGLVEVWRAAPRGCVEFLGVTEESSRQDAA